MSETGCPHEFGTSRLCQFMLGHGGHCLPPPESKAETAAREAHEALASYIDLASRGHLKAEAVEARDKVLPLALAAAKAAQKEGKPDAD